MDDCKCRSPLIKRTLGFSMSTERTKWWKDVTLAKTPCYDRTWFVKPASENHYSWSHKLSKLVTRHWKNSLTERIIPILWLSDQENNPEYVLDGVLFILKPLDHVPLPISNNNLLSQNRHEAYMRSTGLSPGSSISTEEAICELGRYPRSSIVAMKNFPIWESGLLLDHGDYNQRKQRRTKKIGSTMNNDIHQMWPSNRCPEERWNRECYLGPLQPLANCFSTTRSTEQRCHVVCVRCTRTVAKMMRSVRTLLFLLLEEYHSYIGWSAKLLVCLRQTLFYPHVPTVVCGHVCFVGR